MGFSGYVLTGSLFGGGHMGFIGFILAIATFAGAWQVFVKAGREGWEAVIPVYNIYVLTVITAQPWWLLILCLIPVVNFIALGFLYWKLAERFGQIWPFAIGLLLVPFVFYPLLGFGDARYIRPPSPEDPRFLDRGFH
jgi:hypothetical protein